MDNHPKVPNRVLFGLTVFLALAYVANGLGQETGLIDQPLTFYLKETFGWNAEQITNLTWVVIIPWVIKPIYGLISDFFPLFGYRRKSWLFVVNIIAAVGYVMLLWATTPDQIRTGLLVASFGIAASTALCGALLVENGKKYNVSGKLTNNQWIWFFVASIAAALIGGGLCQYLSPSAALHYGALVVALAPAGVLATCFFLIPEEKTQMNKEGFLRSLSSWKEAFKNRSLWLLMLFCFCYHFSPSFGTPLYFYQVNELKFSQQFIGILAAIGAVGSVLGGGLYAWLLRKVTLRTLLLLSIALGTVSQGSYLLLGWDGGYTAVVMQWMHTFAVNHSFVSAGGYWPSGVEAVAIWLAIVNGVMTYIAWVSVLTLAADYCPDGAEGFSYSLLLSVGNGAQKLAAMLGAHLYVQWFHEQLTPLILVSAAFTAAAAIFIPMLALGNKMSGEPPKKDE